MGCRTDDGSWGNALAPACSAPLAWWQCTSAAGVFLALVAAKMAPTDSRQPLIYQAQYIMLITASSFYFGSTSYIIYSNHGANMSIFLGSQLCARWANKG